MSIETKKDAIMSELAAITDSDTRYKFIIAKGRTLPELTLAQKEEKFLVPGCMSRAWLVPEFRDGKVYFAVDSEAAIVKGIMAILVEVYSGNAPAENLALSPDFLKDGGITEHLSLNRRNGLSSFLKQIMLYSTVFQKMSVLNH